MKILLQLMDDENINFDQNKDIDIINLWTDFCKGFAKFIIKD